MNKISYRNLEVFRAVFEAGNMSRAAEQLGITQPAVTRQMQQLEEIIGEPVLRIVKRRAQLTPRGEQLMKLGNVITDEIASISSKLQEQTNDNIDCLNIACTNILNAPLVRLINKLLQRNPNQEFNLYITTDANTITDLLNRHKIDLVLHSHAFDELPHMTSEKVDDLKMHFACSTQSPLATQKQVSTKELLQHPLFTPSRSPKQDSHINQLLKQHKIKSIETYKMDSSFTCGVAVRRNLGVAMLPEFFLNDKVDGRGLQVIDTTTPGLNAPIYLSYGHNDMQSKAFRSMYEILKQDPFIC